MNRETAMRWQLRIAGRGFRIGLLAALYTLTTPAWARLPEPHAAPADVGQELIGTKPKNWTFDTWINSKPLSLPELKGKVVLVRWWTGPDCPFCTASADALEKWWDEYKDRGLVVIGAYHHKSNTPLTRDHVVGEAKRLGFTFPVAIDRDWKTLREWWLDRTDRGWTSVTFLIGGDGKILSVHGGGAYVAGDPGFADLDTAISKALGENKR